jgi:hypothetical protein|tara:strand:+ start:261 stop:503 length:243 start_codon:yes stop_codon:yes gene_type:complete
MTLGAGSILIFLSSTKIAAGIYDSSQNHDWQDKRQFHHFQDDRAILDAALVVGYFNFVNRIVLSLGVYLEQDEGQGYKYE